MLGRSSPRMDVGRSRMTANRWNSAGIFICMRNTFAGSTPTSYLGNYVYFLSTVILSLLLCFSIALILYDGGLGDA